MRTQQRCFSPTLALGFFLGLAVPAVGSSNCVQLHQQGSQALEQHDPEQLRRVYEQAVQTPDCDETFRLALRRRVANAYFNAGRQAGLQGNTAQAVTRLQQALEYDHLWQALASLGDIYHQQKDYNKAAAYYQDALDRLQDTPEPPAPRLIQGMYRKAEESRQLATEHVAVPRHRATGRLAGVYAQHFRGFTPVARLVPITFFFDAAEFDDKGQHAAAELLRFLQEHNPGSISLIGHTDPRGDERYNLHLSQRRAEAVKAYLASSYHGRIHTEGQGESVPYQPENIADYSQEELYRLHRRVELRFE